MLGAWPLPVMEFWGGPSSVEISGVGNGFSDGVGPRVLFTDLSLKRDMFPDLILSLFWNWKPSMDLFPNLFRFSRSASSVSDGISLVNCGLI